MIELRVLGDEVGIGVTDNGNAGVTAVDKRANILVTIELTPDAWRAFLKNAPRLKGVGISVAGRVPIIVPSNGDA